MRNPTPHSLERLAIMFGCTVEQVRKQYRANCADCRKSAIKATAHKTGKYRGFTAEYWTERANAYEQFANE